jgi:hypothetical protein
MEATGLLTSIITLINAASHAGDDLHCFHCHSSILISAASKSTSDTCDMQLFAGANIDARGSAGETVFIEAVENANRFARAAYIPRRSGQFIDRFR